MNPVFIVDLFHRTNWLTHRPQNMQVNALKLLKAPKTQGPHIWNSLPKHIEEENNFPNFKTKLYQIWTKLYMQLMHLNK